LPEADQLFFQGFSRVSAPTLFDYNGVLIDDEKVHLAAFRDVLAPLGVEVLEASYWERYLGFDDLGAFRAILEDAGRRVSAGELAELVEAKRPHYLSRAKTALSAFAGAAEVVRRRASVAPVGIVSGALRDEIALGIELLGIADVVAFVVSAEDTRACKPDPEGYAIAKGRLAELVGTDAERAVVIEDSLAGVQAAKAAGLSCIAVAHSYPESELFAAGADVVVKRIAELADAVFDRLR
jgi:HAD superfamily hydrolase (TIGR01509 family)